MGVDAVVQNAAAGDGEGVELVQRVPVGLAFGAVELGLGDDLVAAERGQRLDSQRGERAGLPPGGQALQIGVVVVAADGGAAVQGRHGVVVEVAVVVVLLEQGAQGVEGGFKGVAVLGAGSFDDFGDGLDAGVRVDPGKQGVEGE